MKSNVKKAIKVAGKFGIKVILKQHIKPDTKDEPKSTNIGEEFISAGQWLGGRTIYINPSIATAYTVLHEIGHVLCKWMCCREHCEFSAHGAAIALAKSHKIRLHPQAYREIDVYAGFSARKACGAIELRGKKCVNKELQ